MKLWSDEKVAEVAEELSELADWLTGLAATVEGFDGDAPNTSMEAIGDALGEDTADRLSKMAKLLRAVRRAHEDGEFAGGDGCPLDDSPDEVAEAVLEAVMASPELLVPWPARDGEEYEREFDLGSLKLDDCEVLNGYDVDGIPATLTVNVLDVRIKFRSDDGTDCEAVTDTTEEFLEAVNFHDDTTEGA